MPQRDQSRRVLVTGATGFVGFRVVAALLEAGAEVSVLVRPDQDDKLAAIADKVKILHGDIWNRGSLKGQARGHGALVHLVGSTRSDPAHGLTYNQINLVSARHAIGMAISDGVSAFCLLSAAALPGMLPTEYIRSKRDAEDYLQNSGLEWMIIRAPFLYVPSPLLQLQALAGRIPPFSWLIGKYMPLSVDIAARGIAAAVMNAPKNRGRILYSSDLRRLSRGRSRRPLALLPAIASRELDLLDETPFGWLPPPAPRRRRDR